MVAENIINDRPLKLTKEGITRASQLLRDSGNIHEVKIQDESRGLDLKVYKHYFSQELLTVYKKNNGLAKFINEDTQYFKDMIKNLKITNTYWVIEISSVKNKWKGTIITASVEEANKVLFNDVMPKFETKKTNPLGKKGGFIFSIESIVRYDKHIYTSQTEEGINFWVEFGKITNNLTEVTLEQLLILREHYVDEIRLKHVGIISLMKLFPWDFRKEEYRLSSDYSKEIFGEVLILKK